MSRADRSGCAEAELGYIAQSVIQDLVYIIDNSGRLVDANDRFFNELGIQQKQSEDIHVGVLINDEDRSVAKRIWQSVTESRRFERSIRRMRNAGGNQRLFDVQETPYIKDGKVLGLVGVARDVTEEFALEERIWESRENTEAALEYAVRASLGLIKGYVFSLQRMERLPAVQRERYGKVIVEEIETLGRNIENLLMSRGQFAEASDNDLCNIISVSHDIAALLKHEAVRREIVVKCPDKEREVLLYTKCEAVHRILLNLADYCMLRITHSGEITVGVGDYEEYIEITVSDSGPEMSDADIAMLFSEVAPAALEADSGAIGSKVDLYVARLLCDSLGGGISARATENRHLEFVVMLPRQSVHPTSIGPNESAGAGK